MEFQVVRFNGYGLFSVRYSQVYQAFLHVGVG